MLRKSGILLTLLAAVVLFAGCDQIKGMFQTSLGSKTATSSAVAQPGSQPVYGTVLAKVNGETITLESFDEKIKNLEALSPEIKINTPEAKKNYLNDLITQELIYQEARSRGIEKQKDVKEAMEEFRKGVMARQLIVDETKGIAVEPTEIEAFYGQYKQAFAAPRQVHARQIVVSSEQAAKDILIQLLQGGDFAALAKERSIDATASKGGDMGAINAAEQFDKFNEVTATLDAGEVSPIFKGPKGYYIVKVDEVTGGQVPQLTDMMAETNMTVYDQIKNGLLQQKQAQRIQDLTDRLRREAKIEIKNELLQ
ncbi:MAG: peptidyl-prolyl cis-trans isomerase [Candidatus Omnitrophica bacterium]|nr:peptidyl-prolyl cis-trans isomerase [Candidatus Omnitrophota bacterium]MDD5573694.1 peptidyl-prolyl cis-trans isomerase [Candidatus Omnitrophota bacterium]